ncbi:hypothetical protein K432DRAFT_314882, partial [Lepidopterella palustris CBS 459.81]
ELAAEFCCTTKCIRDTIHQYRQTGSNKSRPRSGRPPVLSRYKKRKLFRVTRKIPKIKY